MDRLDLRLEVSGALDGLEEGLFLEVVLGYLGDQEVDLLCLVGHLACLVVVLSSDLEGLLVDRRVFPALVGPGRVVSAPCSRFFAPC